MIVTNHVNIFDGFVLRGHLPFPFRALELDSHFRWPIYGTATRLYGNIPIPHRDTARALRSLARARRIVNSGTSLLVLAEGHRTRTGKLGPLMRGPFKLARQVGVPIVPAVMVGAFERKRVGRLRVTPGRVDLRIGTPIPPETTATMREVELRKLVAGRMRALLEDGR